MDAVLDLTGLKCPLPALMTRRALARLAAGARLVVRSDDPLAEVDIPHMCHQEGHAVEGVSRQDGHAEFVLVAGIRRASGKPERLQPDPDD